MRLIDIDRITEADKEAHGFKKDYDLEHLLESQPIVSVGCRYCKHYNNGFCNKIDGLTGAVKKEDYCSRGEKK